MVVGWHFHLVRSFPHRQHHPPPAAAASAPISEILIVCTHSLPPLSRFQPPVPSVPHATNGPQLVAGTADIIGKFPLLSPQQGGRRRRQQHLAAVAVTAVVTPSSGADFWLKKKRRKHPLLLAAMTVENNVGRNYCHNSTNVVLALVLCSTRKQSICRPFFRTEHCAFGALPYCTYYPTSSSCCDKLTMTAHTGHYTATATATTTRIPR